MQALKFKCVAIITISFLNLLTETHLTRAQDTKPEPPVTALLSTPTNTVLRASDAGLVELSWPQLELLRKLDCKLASINSLEFSSDGQSLWVGGGTPGETGRVEQFRWPDGKRMQQAVLHDDVVASLIEITKAESGYRLVSGSIDSTLATSEWQANEVHSIATRDDHSQGVLALTRAGEDIWISGGIDRQLHVWDTQTGRKLRTLDQHTDEVTALATKPMVEEEAQKQLAVIASASKDGTIRFWQPKIGRMLRLTRLPTSPIDLIWDQRGEWIFALTEDGSLYRVDPIRLKQEVLKTFQDRWITVIAIAPDSQHLIIGGENQEVSAVKIEDFENDRK